MGVVQVVEKEIAERIRKMAQFLDIEHIARTLNLSVDVVQGVLDGEVSDKVLRNYNPAYPPDVRVVEKKKFVRSRVIGIVSPGGCGATTLTAALALLSAAESSLPISALDLNEFAALGGVLGVDAMGERAVRYPNILWWPGELDEITVRHAELENLLILLGAPTTERYMEIKMDMVDSLLAAMAQRFLITWVDCPTSVQSWKTMLPWMDLIVIVLRADEFSLSALWQMLMTIHEAGIEERCGLVFNLTNSRGWLSASECRRRVREFSNLPVLATLPDDLDVRGRELFVLRHSKHPYTNTARKILRAVWPETAIGEKQGVFKSLAAIFSR